MDTVLVVPVHLDALCLATDRSVTEPSADFTRLPYVDPDDGHDHQPDQPYLSETLLAEPFADQGSLLKAGVHLHWSLPDTLTRIAPDGTPVPVPNRWLVTRAERGKVAAQWVVESDYLTEGDTGGVPYPYVAGQMAGPERLPYRRLGRRVPLAAWQPPGDRAEYLRTLTAVGYGEPTFASFYPHCYSVFGLHDPAYAGVPPAGVSYDVLGWYADPATDVLPAALAGAGADWPEVLRTALLWTVDLDAAGGARPGRTVCWARLTVAPAPGPPPPPATGETGVWVGNTGTEALAAHLGAVLPPALPGVGQDELENWLEALAYAATLESATLDVDLKLREARHASTFQAVPAGDLWSVRDPTGNDPDLAALPGAAGAALNALNVAQAAADRAAAALTDLRAELYADWYRYMICVYPADSGRDSYPDPDQALFHLRRKIALIDRQQAALATLTAARDATRAAASTALGSDYVLESGPAPQYYLPNEPVVLLTGEAASPSDRFGQDGVLACAVVDGDPPAEATGAARTAQALRQQVTAASVPGAERTWTEQPWHPLLMQWEVEFFPAGRAGNLGPADRDYGTGFITANYTLAADDIELTPVTTEPVLARAADAYVGSSVLSPAARPVLAARILGYLAGPVLTALAGAVTEDAYQADPGPAFDRYLALAAPDRRIRALIGVYRHLAENEANNLAQVLGGFNDALLMRRLVRQLPVADPLGFPAYRAVTENEVAPAVAGESRHTPQPLSDFNPIRAGAMRLLRLRLVDTFGIARDVPVGTVGTTSQLRVPGHPGWVALPPRLAQPAQLALRWLDAESDVAEMNADPATSPVCGWLLANHIDGSVEVHAADGSALGAVHALPDAVTGVAQWRAAPGRAAVAVAGIGNRHLRAVVARLISAGPDRVAAFLAALDAGLGAIEPEDPADASADRGHALLVSRPVAVARATVGLELAGRPAVHQDWNVFRQDLRRSAGESNGFTRVTFPIRLGDHQRLGDGLVGYWVEAPDGTLGPDFVAVADGPPAPLPAALDTPAQALTMLIDPACGVHVCCGVLPAKSLRIPPAHYRQALSGLAVSFLAAPVLGDAAGPPEPPVPDEPGFLWSWLEADGRNWAETAAEPLVVPAALDAAFPDVPGLSAALVAAGWLAPLDAGTALVVPAETRPPLPAPLAAQPDPFAADLAAALAPPTLGVPRAATSFPARVSAREGWLALRPRPAIPAPSTQITPSA